MPMNDFGVDYHIAMAERHFRTGRINSQTCKVQLATLILEKCEAIHGGVTEESMRQAKYMYDAKLRFLGIDPDVLSNNPLIEKATAKPF